MVDFRTLEDQARMGSLTTPEPAAATIVEDPDLQKNGEEADWAAELAEKEKAAAAELAAKEKSSVSLEGLAHAWDKAKEAGGKVVDGASKEFVKVKNAIVPAAVEEYVTTAANKTSEFVSTGIEKGKKLVTKTFGLETEQDKKIEAEKVAKLEAMKNSPENKKAEAINAAVKTFVAEINDNKGDNEKGKEGAFGKLAAEYRKQGMEEPARIVEEAAAKEGFMTTGISRQVKEAHEQIEKGKSAISNSEASTYLIMAAVSAPGAIVPKGDNLDQNAVLTKALAEAKEARTADGYVSRMYKSFDDSTKAGELVINDPSKKADPAAVTTATTPPVGDKTSEPAKTIPGEAKPDAPAKPAGDAKPVSTEPAKPEGAKTEKPAEPPKTSQATDNQLTGDRLQAAIKAMGGDASKATASVSATSAGAPQKSASQGIVT